MSQHTHELVRRAGSARTDCELLADRFGEL